jgi:membrane-bound lytic murein transglycosylase A
MPEPEGRAGARFWAPRAGLCGTLAAILLQACAATGAPPPSPDARVDAPSPLVREAPSALQARERELFEPAAARLSVASLPGWAEEDHAAALRAYQTGCGAAADPPLRTVCWRARSMAAADDLSARRFFEDNFRAERVVPQGILTGYFVPEYEARTARRSPFTAAVLPRPDDLTGAYPDRGTIEAQPPDRALAWMRPEDLFFMQIQGSGVLDFPDGRRLKAVFAASNSRPFVPIGGVLRNRGLLADQQTSAETIRAWLADHRGRDADEIMRLNPRYIFFSLIPDDGADPPGTAGLAMIPGRSIAVDPAEHALGGLYWLDASAPALTGAFPIYRRLALALDTGAAIKGPARVDLYFGRGDAAGAEAGRVRHALGLYQLVPVDQDLR